MPLVLYILRLLLGLLVGWWRDAVPLVVRKDGRLQTWKEDDAADAAVGQLWGALPSSRAAPLWAVRFPGCSSTGRWKAGRS